MKVKFLLLSLAMLLSTIIMAGNATATGVITHTATVKTNAAVMTKEQKEARTEAIKARVMEIKAMDKSQLSRDDRKALKKELRQLNHEYHAVGTKDLAIVILGGAIAAALLLLIIA